MGFSKKDIQKEFCFLYEFNFRVLPYVNSVSSDHLICYDDGLILISMVQYRRDLSILISQDRNKD
jgi:hypothetical protein